MKLYQIEKRIPQTLTNSNEVIQKGQEYARRSSVLDDRAPPLSQGLDPALLLIHNTMVTMDYVHVI